MADSPPELEPRPEAGPDSEARLEPDAPFERSEASVDQPPGPPAGEHPGAAAAGETDEPAGLPGPGFGLSFIEGKALVGFAERPIADWLRVRDFTLEVPHVRFPFDVTAGAETFRNRRCRLVGLAFEADEEGFARYVLEHLRPSLAGERSPLCDLEIAFGEGFVEIGGSVAAGRLDDTGGDASAPGARLPFTLKVGADASADREARLLLHDCRIYGPSSLPAPAVAVALLDLVRESGLPVTVESPSVLRLDPITPYLRRLLPRHGWKLADSRDIRLSAVSITKGRITLTFDAGKTPQEPPDSRSMRSFLSALEGSLAFAAAEEALAEGRHQDATRAWLLSEGPLPDHPFATERLLALLLADPSTADDAFDLAEAWIERDGLFVPALLTRAMVRAHSGATGAGADLLEVARIAAERGEVLGARQAASAAGRRAEAEARAAEAEGRGEEARSSFELAASAFERCMAARPSDRYAAVALSRIYPRLADLASAERVLKKRLRLAASDEERADIHLSLGRLHSRETAALGVPAEALAEAPRAEERRAPFHPDLTRAKLHLDAALRHDPRLAEAWITLGRACVRAKETLRAVRCLDKGRELLIGEGRCGEAAEASRAIALLWERDLDHPENAVLRYQQVLEVVPQDIHARLRHSELSLSLGHVTEAESGFQSVLETLERGREETSERRPGGAAMLSVEQARAALTAHRALAAIAREHYSAPDAAMRHLEQALSLCPAAGAEEESAAILREIVRAAEATSDPALLADACDRAAAAETDPIEQASLLARSAHLHLGLGDGESARSRAARARGLDPEGLDPLVARAAVEAAFGAPEDHAAALDDLARRTTDAADRSMHLLELGQLCLEALATPKASLRPLAEARDSAPDPSVARRASELHLEACRRIGEPEAIAASLESHAKVEGRGARERAGALLEAALIHERDMGDLAAARGLHEAARKIEPEDPRPAWHLGRLLHDAGEHAGAWSALLDMNALGGASAAGVPPEEAEPLLGEAALEAGDKESAVRHLLRACELTPGDTALEAKALFVLDELGRGAEAALLLRHAASAHAALGDRAAAASRLRRAASISEEGLGDLEAAERDLDEAMNLAFPPDRAWASIGSEIEWSPPHAEALEAANERLRLADRTGDVLGRAAGRLCLAGLASRPSAAAEHLLRRSDDLLSLDDVEGATACLEKTIDLDENRVDARERLAELLWERKPAMALDHVEWLLARSERDAPEPTRSPELLERRLSAAELAVSASLPERARHHLSVYVAHRPSDTSASARLAEILRGSQRYSELYSLLVHHAQSLTSKSSGDAPFEEAARALLDAASIALERLGRADLARSALEMVLQQEPDHLEALRALLPLLDGVERAEARADVLARLADLESSPGRRADYLCERGVALFDHDLNEASLAYAQALEEEPSSTRAADGLAAAAWRSADISSFVDACAVRAEQAARAREGDAAIRLLVSARLRLDLQGDTRHGLALLNLALDPSLRCTLSAADLREALRRRLACHLSSGDAAGALADLGDLIDLSRDEAPSARAALHRRRAGLREAAGEAPGAREDWAEAHRLDRDDPLALDRLIALAESDGDMRALAHLHGRQAAQAAKRGEGDSAALSLFERARILDGPLDDRASAAAALESAARLVADAGIRREILERLRETLFVVDRVAEAMVVAREEAAMLPPEEGSRLLLASAGIAEESGRRDLALAATRLAASTAPSDPLIAAWLLRRLRTAGAIEECVEPARLLASLDPVELATALDRGETEAEEHHRLAALLLAEVGDDAAWPLLDRLCESAPSDALLVETFASLCLHRGDICAARRVLEAHAKAVPTKHGPRIARRLAELARQAEDAGAEAAWLKRALALEGRGPSEEEARRLLEALLRAGDMAEYARSARLLIEEILSSEPERACSELAAPARLLQEQGAHEESLELLSAFDDLRGESTELLSLWLAAAEAAGRDDEAMEARGSLVQELIEEGDDEAAADHLVLLGAAQEAGGDLEAARSSLHEAILRGRREAEVMDRALSVARSLCDAASEADLLEIAVDSTEDPAEAASHLETLAALFLGPLDSPRRAEAALRGALERAPRHQEAREALEELLLSEGRHLDVAEMIRARAKSEEGEPRAMLRLAAARHLLEVAHAEDAVHELLDARTSGAEAFEREQGEKLLDQARAAAGMHRERAEARLSLPGGPGAEAGYIEAGDILRDEVDDLRAAAEAYRRAFREAASQRAAERLRGVLSAIGDHRGLADLAVEEAESAPPGVARVSLLRSAGDLFVEAGDAEAAIETWRAALAEAPGDQALLERLRAALEEAGRKGELAEVMRMLAESADGSQRAEALLEAARLHEAAGDRVNVIACLMEAENADPSHEEATRRLADALWDAGNREEALKRYLRVLPREPLGSHSHERVSEQLKAEGRIRELAEVSTARATAARAAGEGRLALDLYLRAVRLWIQAGEPSATRAAAFGAFHLDPAGEEPFQAVLRCVREAGDRPWIVEVLEAHLEALPADAPARVERLRMLVEARMAAGDGARARTCLDELVEAAGADGEVAGWALRTVLESDWRDKDQRALELSEKVVELARAGSGSGREELEKAHEILGKKALEEGSPGAAATHLDTALSLSTERARRHDLARLLSQACSAAERSADAARAFLLLADLEEDDAVRIEALCHAAESFEKDGDSGGAHEAWRRVFDLRPASSRAHLALSEAASDPAEQLRLLQAHADAVEEPRARLDLLLRMAALGEEIGDEGLATRSRLEAWRLDTSHAVAAELALPALRGGSGGSSPDDLALALSVVAERAGPPASISLLAEAAKVSREAGDVDSARARSGEAVSLAEAALSERGSEAVDEALASAVVDAASEALEHTDDPLRSAELSRLCARVLEGSRRVEQLMTAARRALEADRPDEARRDLEAALETSPGDPRAAAELLRLDLETGELQAAAEVAVSISSRQGDAAALLEVASAAEKAGSHELLAKLLTAAVRFDKQSPELCARLVEARLAADDPHGAAASAALHVERLQESPASDEALIAAMARAAELHSAVEQPLIARSFWEEALGLDPTHEGALAALELFHRSRGSFGELLGLHLARAEMLASLGDFESSAAACVAAADAALEDDDLGVAIDALETALRRLPSFGPARAKLAELTALAGRGDDDEVATKALQATVQAADSPRARAEAELALARHHEAGGREAEASEAFFGALSWARSRGDEEPSSGLRGEILRVAGLWLGSASLASGDGRAAGELIGLAVSAGATGRRARLLQARASEAAGDLEEARDAWRRLAEQDEDEDEALEGLLRVAAGLEDLESELWALTRKAERADAGDGAARMWLAVAARAHGAKLGEREGEALRRAFEAEPSSKNVFQALRRHLEERDDVEGLLDLLRRWARSTDDDSARAEAFLEEGRLALERAEDPARAIEALERSLAIDAEGEEAAVLLAHLLHDSGAHARAEQILRGMPEGAPGIPAFLTHQRLGEYALASERYEQALEAFRTAASHNPSFVEAWSGGLEAARKLGDGRAEVEQLRGLLEVSPGEDADDERLGRLLELARAEIAIGEPATATERLEAARRMSSDDPAILVELLDAYKAQERWSKAASTLTTLSGLTEEGPERARLLVELSDLCAGHLDDPHGAGVALRGAAATDPDNVEAWRRILARAVDSGERLEIARAAVKLVELDQEESLSRWPLEIGRALIERGHAELAAPLLEAASFNRPGDREVANEAAMAAVNAGRLRMALGVLDSLAAGTTDPADRRAAAEAALAAGDRQGYVDRMLEGLDDDSFAGEPRLRAVHGLAPHLRELGDHPRALAMLEEAASCPRAGRWAKHDMAGLLLEMGREDEARDAWQSLARSDPSDLPAVRSLAPLVEKHDGDRARLLFALERYLSGEAQPEENWVEETNLEPSSLRVDDAARAAIADPLAWGPVARLLREMAPVLEPLFPADPGRYGVSSADLLLPESEPAAARARQWAEALGAAPFNVYRGERLGFEICIENTRPSSVVVSAALLAASRAELDQLLCRSVELASAGYALVGKFADADVGVLVRLCLSFFHEEVEVPIPADKLGAYHEAMARLCPEEKRAALAPLAAEALESLPRFDPGSLAPALRRTADRITLLCTGDVRRALDWIMLLDPRSTGEEKEKREAVRSEPALFDLCRFLLREDAGELWRRLRGR